MLRRWWRRFFQWAADMDETAPIAPPPHLFYSGPQDDPYIRKIVKTVPNYKGAGWTFVTLECGHWALNHPEFHAVTGYQVCSECRVNAEVQAHAKAESKR